jgi:hypothetical protein
VIIRRHVNLKTNTMRFPIFLPARRNFCLGLVASLAPLSAWASSTASPLQRIQALLQSPADGVDARRQITRGQFEQRKTLLGFKNSLLSRGNFLVAPGQGIVWDTQQPYPSTLILTPKRLRAQQADGRITTEIEAQSEPAIRAINALLFAVMALDWPVLEQGFTLQAEFTTQQGWQLRLTPREPAIGQWIAHITLEGDQRLRHIYLQEAQGDTSRITLSQHTSSLSLSAQEAARFE